jgi:DNA excision repair protein ERCC-2
LNYCGITAVEGRKLPQTYACRNCGRLYSLEEYVESRFCRDCETYLLPQSKVKKLVKRIRRVAKPSDKDSVARRDWLPDGYQFRKGQTEFIKEASRAIRGHRLFLGNAPCGIGKSLASILAVLPHIEKSKLLITFRTRNQLHIYLKELKAAGCGLPTVSLFSKQSMCPMRIGGNISYYDFFEQCKRLKENCEPLQKPYCRFYLKNLRKKKEAETLALDSAKRFLAPTEATRFFVKRGFCAYEALRGVLNKAKIFLGTYHYVFDPQIRGFILKDFGVGLDSVYLIVDEAHNIPAFARELLSDQLTETTLDRAFRETERFAHENISSVRELLEVLDEQVFRHAKKILKKQELKRLQPRNIDDLYLEHCGVLGGEAAKTLIEYGEHVKQKKQELGHENLLSYNHRVGEFLRNFFEKLGEKYTHLISRDWRKGIALEVRGFDGREVTSPVLRQTRGSVLMSGSLSPPQIYRDLMIYDSSDVVVREFDSPFPSENRLLLGANDVSSRFELRTRGMFEKWRQYIEAVSRVNRGNVAFFFTSYDLMQSTLKLIKMSRNVIVEQRRTRRSSVLNVLHRSTNNALFGVMGGKFSEGIDYPDNVLTCVVAVGLPYATWNVYQKGLIDYYNRQFPEKGETYAYLTPAILRLIQTSGRVHRSPDDKGCIVILDERVTKPGVKRQLPKYFRQEMRIVKSVADCAEKIEEFWQTHC